MENIINTALIIESDNYFETKNIKEKIIETEEVYKSFKGV